MKEEYIIEIDVGKTLDPKKAVKSLNLSSNDHYLSRATLLENFLLMNTQSRNVSMFFINSMSEYKEAESLTKQLGIGFKTCPSFIPDPKGGYHIFLRGFTFIDESKPKEIDSLHISKPANKIDAQFQFSPILHKRMGDMLEYPFCCVRAYMQDVFLLVDPDERIQEQVNYYKNQNKKINSDSFYLDEFLPCRPDCEKASNKGRNYENDLRLQVNDAVAVLYRNIKSEHMKDVESGKMFKKKTRGKKRYFIQH